MIYSSFPWVKSKRGIYTFTKNILYYNVCMLKHYTIFTRHEDPGIIFQIIIVLILVMKVRVKSGKFGHQVNSDTHLETV